MSIRCRHDLNSSITQLRSTLNQWRESQMLVEESWNDETAQRFREEHLSDAESILNRTIASLQEACDLIRKIEKKSSDTHEQS
ncbi:MAG: hypothetical protein KGQ60_15600, partial [Planctomycetes bacterium]|nr:hypothetical protein [Planctomycetota bacterium]